MRIRPRVKPAAPSMPLNIVCFVMPLLTMWLEVKLYFLFIPEARRTSFNDPALTLLVLQSGIAFGVALAVGAKGRTARVRMAARYALVACAGPIWFLLAPLLLAAWTWPPLTRFLTETPKDDPPRAARR